MNNKGIRLKLFLIILTLLLCVPELTFGNTKNYIETQTIVYGQDTLHFYKHATSGLNVLWIENDDKNLSFTLGVKTPTKDSTGVNHIIEHTLFTGSKKYPSSTVFFDASAQYPTLFMNALTSADLTLFPFCTPYKNCYEQLLDIYMDSIFNPNMLNQPYSFYEESFYYNPMTQSYGGVVYNEMKGANADPGRIIYKALRKGFYEGTHYANDSGGSVEAIPTLSYEQFVDTYHNHYYPNNMMIVVYGDLSINPVLKQIHNYVKDYALTDQWIDVNVPIKKHTEALEVYYPSDKDEMTLIKGFLIEDELTVEEALELDLWVQTYWASEDSKLKLRLKELGINEVEVIKDDGTQYPVYAIIVQDVAPYEKDKITALLETAWRETLCAKDKNKEEEVLHQIQFKMKELAQEGLRGINLSDYMIESWAHNQNYSNYYTEIDALEKINQLDLDINQFFDKEIYQRSIHLLPTPENELKPLDNSPVQEDQWQSMNESMWSWQKENSHHPLPTINPKQMLMKVNLPDKSAGDIVSYLTTPINTDILQTHVYQSVDHIKQEELPYLFIYTELLKQVAKEHQPSNGKTGVNLISVDTSLGDSFNYLDIQILSETPGSVIPTYTALQDQLNNKSIDWYQNKLEQYALTIKSQLQSDILSTLKLLNAGGQSGAKRYQYERYYPLYQWLTALTAEEQIYAIAQALEIGKTIGFNEKSIIGITSSQSSADELKLEWEQYISENKTPITAYNKYHFEKHKPLNMYYQNTPVDYIVCSYDKGADWVEGADYVLAAYATHHYLQPVIRVEKGAYGSGMSASYPNTLSLYTYRDPDYKSSIESLSNLSQTLQGTVTQEDMEQVQVEALSNFQKQIKLLGNPLERSTSLERLVLSGVAEEELIKLQKDILNTTTEDLEEKLMLFKYMLPKYQFGICTTKSGIKSKISCNNYEIN